MLELDGLTKRYGDQLALDRLSFTVRPGQVLGFVGPNGAGKTTAMRAVLGVLTLDAGEIRWQGRPVDPAVRRHFGYMPEERGLYPKMRVGDQLAYLARLHGCDRAGAQAAVTHWAERLGLTDRLGDRLEALSLGNQQRAQLAAALVHEPELLVLDEPFSGLDPVGVDVLGEVLLDVARRGVPVVFSSHQLELVERLCDAVVVISRGRLVADGTVAELRAGHGSRAWAVSATGAGRAWADQLAGVTVQRAEGDDLLLVLDENTDEQAVLDAARAAGRVRRFAPVERSLADLFREVVSA